MARDDTGGGAGKEHHTSRRAVLRAAGVTTLALAGSGAASAQSTGEQTVVDLGNEGLAEGDSIDSYLETHLADGVEVRIPAGTYQYTGAGLGGAYTDAALVGSPDGVEFQRPADPETTVTPTITAASGTVRIENISVTGECGQAQSRWEVGAADGASVHLLNVNFPDGAVADSASMGVYAAPDHAGLLWVKGCHFAAFANVALHVSDPAGSGDGRAVVEDCSFVNTGSAAVSAAPDNSTVRGSYFEATSAAPAGTGGQRGIQVPVPGSDLTVVDCDFNWAGPGTSVVDFAAGGEGGSGALQDLRVGYGDQTALFATGWDIEAGWTGENISVSEA